jgi:hypothetical protein
MEPSIRDREFIGQGVAFPFSVTPRGGVALAAGVNDIEQSIRIILSTIPGERVMRPKFGCRAWELLFDPNNAVTHALMTDYVREALMMWEPRIVVQRVNTFRDPDRHEAMIVEIEYEVKSTHDERSIVYPFYIAEE